MALDSRGVNWRHLAPHTLAEATKMPGLPLQMDEVMPSWTSDCDPTETMPTCASIGSDWVSGMFHSSRYTASTAACSSRKFASNSFR